VALGDLNPTSYLILGMLTSGDRSAYEIAVLIGRGLDDVWARAERQRYNAPKRLLEEGLVSARTEATGKRERTVYSITSAGRRALRDWLATESLPPALEFEGMVRVVLADVGSIEDLRANLETMRHQAIDKQALYLAHAATMLDEVGGTFPERHHVLVLANRFMLDYFSHIAAWADWALDQTGNWPDTVSPATSHRSRSREILEESIERGLNRIEGNGRRSPDPRRRRS
jgi:DNA-binding PadR family transcriptional regulator